MKSAAMKFENIIPACYAETLLMKTIGYECHTNHQSGDGNVLNVLYKQRNNNLCCVGVMDKPKGASPSHIKSDFIDQVKGPNNLVLKKHFAKNHYLIYIDELLEDWIAKIGASKKVKAPFDHQTFKSQMKMSSLLSNTKICNYFSEIRDQNPESFQTIQSWLNKINRDH